MAAADIPTGSFDFFNDLVGIWEGPGFNQIILPTQDRSVFRRKFDATFERFEFTPDIGPVANRGFKRQGDINLRGVRYLQTVRNRDLTPEGKEEELHVEPGFFLSVPATTVPEAGASIVRQGSIPHGTNVLLQGSGFKIDGGPTIVAADTTPISKEGVPLSGPYLTLAPTPALPAGIPAGSELDPNLVLKDVLKKQEDAGDTILDTIVFDLKTGDKTDGTGISNIAFLQPDPKDPSGDSNNAAATKVTSVFWIERVRKASGVEFLQLQYTQTVMLNFDNGIDWPHVSVATLTKVLPSPPLVPLAPPEFRIIRIKHSGKVFDVEAASTDSYARVIQYSFHGGDNQMFRFEPGADGWGVIRMKHSMKVLDIKDGSCADGAVLQQWPEATGRGDHGNQLFKWEPRGDGWGVLKIKRSDKVLDVKDESVDDLASVIQWPEHGSANQLVRFETFE